MVKLESHIMDFFLGVRILQKDKDIDLVNDMQFSCNQSHVLITSFQSDGKDFLFMLNLETGEMALHSYSSRESISLPKGSTSLIEQLKALIKENETVAREFEKAD